MNKGICYNFAVTFIALGLLVGCKSLTPIEATQSAGDETRILIEEHVNDEMRAKQLIELVDQLGSGLMAYVEIQTAHNNALCKKMPIMKQHAKTCRTYMMPITETHGLSV